MFLVRYGGVYVWLKFTYMLLLSVTALFIPARSPRMQGRSQHFSNERCKRLAGAPVLEACTRNDLCSLVLLIVLVVGHQKQENLDLVLSTAKRASQSVQTNQEVSANQIQATRFGLTWPLIKKGTGIVLLQVCIASMLTSNEPDRTKPGQASVNVSIVTSGALICSVVTSGPTATQRRRFKFLLKTLLPSIS